MVINFLMLQLSVHSSSILTRISRLFNWRKLTMILGPIHAKIPNSEQLKICCELADQALYTAKQNGRNNFYSKSGNVAEDVCFPLKCQ